MKHIIKEYEDDKIAFKEARKKLEVLRDRQTEEPTEQPTEEPFNNTVDEHVSNIINVNVPHHETIVQIKSSVKTTSKFSKL